MSKICLIKTMQGTLAPASEDDAEKLKRFKLGGVVTAEVKQMRGYKFHQKWFTLAQLAFQYWVEFAKMPEYLGVVVQPNFDEFRKALTIMAGYFDVAPTIDGLVKPVAKSISFASMQQDEFEKLYQATITAVLEQILVGRGIDEDRLHSMVDGVLSYS
jgi:Protein of unknown function (DUF1367)